jgi:RNase P/RNase MRP subunit POP5
MEHCLFEERQAVFMDAVTGEVQDLRRYLAFDRVAAPEGQTFAADVALVPPEVRASAVVRHVLGDVMHPPNADEMHEEDVAVDHLDLYYRPVYALEYVWEAKGKRITVEVDGLTGEFKPTGKAFGDQLKNVLKRDVLFAIGGDALNFVVPGGSIAVKLTKAVLDSRQPKRP